MRELHQAGLGSEGTCEGPFVVSKEFRFEQIFGQRSAVDRNERICRARTAAMNRPSGEFFSRARLSAQQNTGVGAGGSIRTRNRLFESMAFTDHPRQRLFSGRGLSGEAEHAQQQLRIEGGLRAGYRQGRAAQRSRRGAQGFIGCYRDDPPVTAPVVVGLSICRRIVPLQQ